MMFKKTSYRDKNILRGKTGGGDLQDAEDVFHGFISRKHFEQTITGKNNKPETEKDREKTLVTETSCRFGRKKCINLL